MSDAIEPQRRRLEAAVTTLGDAVERQLEIQTDLLIRHFRSEHQRPNSARRGLGVQ